MDNENLFELMEKIYNVMQEIKNDTKDLKESQIKSENVQNQLESDVSFIKNTVLKIEKEHDRKTDVLFDEYKKNTNILERVGDQVYLIEQKLQTQEVEVPVLRSKT